MICLAPIHKLMPMNSCPGIQSMTFKQINDGHNMADKLYLINNVIGQNPTD